MSKTSDSHADPAEPLDFSILGPLEVRREGTVLDLGPFKQRVLLAALLCRPNEVLSVAQLMDAIWNGAEPRTARKNLQVYVCALRKIAGGRVRHVAYGYALEVGAGEVDLLRFTALATEGRRAARTGDPEGASVLLAGALGLWRGRPAVDLLANSFIAAESDTLMESYLAVYEDWADLEIRAGRHLALIDELRRLARRNPFRERLAMALMTSLFQAGNRRDALAHYEEYRQLMARELGLAPSPVLQRLYQDILNGRSGEAPKGAVRIRGRDGGRPAAVLPRSIPDFVGREEQVASLVDALGGGDGSAEAGVAVVFGGTGTGKTTLAVHAGHLLAHRFADGQIFVALRDERGLTRPWREVLGELMHATGLDVPVPAEDEAAAGVWRSWIADRRFLFVLDDAPDAPAARRLLPGQGASATIVTSCWTLGDLEAGCRLALGEFSRSEALRLLELALGAPRTAQADAAVDRLMRRCGGQPLVIRIIAARLMVLRHLSLQDFAGRLDAAGDLLDELSIGDRSVRTRFDRFYLGLAPGLRAAFRALGSLASPTFQQDEVRAALRDLPGSTEHLLEGLMDVALLAAVVSDTESPAPSLGYAMPPAAYHYSVALHRGAVEPERLGLRAAM